MPPSPAPRATAPTRTSGSPGSGTAGRWLVVGLLLVGAMAADAAPIYRWVDKHGKTHFSDVVPGEYKDVATPLNVKPSPPSPDRAGRAADPPSLVKEGAVGAAPAAPAPSKASPPSVAASRPKVPTRLPTDTTDCDTWQRLYQISADCFGPYRTVGGGIKPEAFDRCTPVAEPPPRCRIRAR